MAAKKTRKKTAKKATRRSPKSRRAAPNSTTNKGWPGWAPQFLEEVANSGHVTSACGECLIARSTPYRLAERDAEFDEAFRNAVRVGLRSKHQELRENSLERAIHGVRVDVFDKDGNVTGTRDQFFPQLEIFHLRMGLPSEYNLGAGDTTGGGEVSPELQAAKIRQFVQALELSIPK